ncbi:MAG: hypothetical protein QM756_26205 [Polyangiaceae bacterium]
MRRRTLFATIWLSVGLGCGGRVTPETSDGGGGGALSGGVVGEGGMLSVGGAGAVGGTVSFGSTGAVFGGSASAPGGSPSTSTRDLGDWGIALTTDEATSLTVGACPGDGYLTPEPVAIEVLVETSLSMKAEMSPGRSRWDVTREGLLTLFGQLPARDQAGLSTFPNVQASPGDQSPTACIATSQNAPLAPLGLEQLALIESSLNGVELLGATPTEDAYAFAFSQLADRGTLEGNLVLFTDGPPTHGRPCQGNGVTPVAIAPLITNIAVALGNGVRTFVVALGPKSDEDWLSLAAFTGGTGGQYRVPDGPAASKQLYVAMSRVREQLSSCRFRLPPEYVQDNANLVVEFAEGDAALIRYSKLGEQCRGWRAETSSVVSYATLCPSACQALRDAVDERIYVANGCSGVGVPNP